MGFRRQISRGRQIESRSRKKGFNFTVDVAAVQFFFSFDTELFADLQPLKGRHAVEESHTKVRKEFVERALTITVSLVSSLPSNFHFLIAVEKS